MTREIILRQAYAEGVRREFPSVFVTRDRESTALLLHYRGRHCRISAEEMRYARWNEVQSRIRELIGLGDVSGEYNSRYMYKVSGYKNGRSTEATNYIHGEFDDIKKELMDKFFDAAKLTITDLKNDVYFRYQRFSNYYEFGESVWVQTK